MKSRRRETQTSGKLRANFGRRSTSEAAQHVVASYLNTKVRCGALSVGSAVKSKSCAHQLLVSTAAVAKQQQITSRMRCLWHSVNLGVIHATTQRSASAYVCTNSQKVINTNLQSRHLPSEIGITYAVGKCRIIEIHFWKHRKLVRTLSR